MNDSTPSPSVRLSGGDLSEILVPVDFSDHSRAAIQRAAELAETTGARLWLLHVLDLPPLLPGFMISESIWKGLREAVEVELAAQAKALRRRGLSVATCVQEGNAADSIRAAAYSSNIEIIVMGSHGRRGTDRVLLGSVAERTLHMSPVPVMIVRESEEYAAQPIEKILFATDFSNGSERAEASLIRLARATRSDVEVFHAIQETAVLFAPYAVDGVPSVEVEIHEGARLRMESCLKRLQDAGLNVHPKIVNGFASEEILKRAELSDVDLIAMGTRGYAGMRRFRLGSVSQRVMRGAPCSVFVAGRSPAEPTLA